MPTITIIKKAFREFVELSHKVSRNNDLRLGGVRLSMLWCLLRYGARPADYDYFDFWSKSGVERKRYLTFYKYIRLVKKLNCKEFAEGGKFVEYNVYSSFIKRSWMLADKNTTEASIKEFISRHHVIIAKPIDGEQGHGIVKIDDGNEKDVQDLLINKESSPYILEEVLYNCPELNEIVSSSLNTIRCYTLIDKYGNPHIMEIMLRVGKVGSVVDNWGAGGVGYVFDLETGICDQRGIDKLGRRYIYHPGTQFKMVGFKLPYFEELKRFVINLCKVRPDVRYAGWDIAITPNGLELVEMNCPGGRRLLQVYGRPWGDFIKHNW